MVRKRKKPEDPDLQAEVAALSAQPTASKKKKKKNEQKDTVPAEVIEAEKNTNAGTAATKAKKGKNAEAKASNEAAPEPKGNSRNARKRAAKRAQQMSNAATVILGGLPYSTTGEDLRQDFKSCGEIVNLNVPQDPATGRARGFAFVTFATKEGADGALEFDGKEFKGRTISARMAGERPESKTALDAEVASKSSGACAVFVGGLPYSIDGERLKEHFAESGAIQDLKLPLDDAGKTKGFAFITFATRKSAKKALECSGDELDGRQIVVRMSDADKGQSKDRLGKSQGRGDPATTVFVSGLPYFTKEKKLQNCFAECGTILSLTLPMCSWDATQSRGFAFITFASKASAKKALELDGKEYEDRYMSVKMSSDPGKADIQKGSARKIQEEQKKPTQGVGNAQSLNPDDLKTDRERGALVKATGKRVEFDSDDD